MADILDEVDAGSIANRPTVPKKTVKSENRRKVRILSPPPEHVSKYPESEAKAIPAPHTPLDENDITYDDDLELPPLENEDTIMSDPLPSSPVTKAVERRSRASNQVENEDDDEDEMEVSRAVDNHAVKGVAVNMSGSRPPLKVLKNAASYPTPESSSPTRAAGDTVDATTWNKVTEKLNVLSSPDTVSYGKIKITDALEDDGSLRMFWTDYTEVNGSLCLFGKVKVKNSGKFVSAFVKVDNILRKLFFLPRSYRKSKSLNASAALY